MKKNSKFFMDHLLIPFAIFVASINLWIGFQNGLWLSSNQTMDFYSVSAVGSEIISGKKVRKSAELGSAAHPGEKQNRLVPELAIDNGQKIYHDENNDGNDAPILAHKINGFVVERPVRLNASKKTATATSPGKTSLPHELPGDLLKGGISSAPSILGSRVPHKFSKRSQVRMNTANVDRDLEDNYTEYEDDMPDIAQLPESGDNFEEFFFKERIQDSMIVKEERLRREIEILTERIANGESDKQYNLWIKHKNPLYVIHDSQRLEQYENDLEQLIMQMMDLKESGAFFYLEHYHYV